MTVVPDQAEHINYDLSFAPDGSSWTVRENLSDILRRELLGPADGDTEEIDNPPDTAYLIGRIAPVRLTSGTANPTEADSDDVPLDVGDALEARESRGVPVTAVDDSATDGDEDQDEPPKRGLMIPASMGLRFQIPNDLTEFTVISSWGVYNPFDTGEQYKSGQAVRRYRREPIDIAKVVRVADLTPGETHGIALQDKVCLRIDCYEDRALDRKLIEIALCNDRETPRKIPVNAWLFQTKLKVDAAGGAAVFLPVNDVLNDSRPEPNDELRRLNLQYRDRLEFAIGRTCSVDWHAEPGARRASRVWTTWLPISETAQISANEIAEAELDMRALAAADAAAIDAGLRPIVAGYATWLEQQTMIAADLPEHLQPEAAEAINEAGRVAAQLEAGLTYLLGDVEALRCFRFMNRVMADQRDQSQVAELRSKQPTLSRAAALEQILAKNGARAHSWRTFQVAFILMQIEGLSKPESPRRSGNLTKVELLFFPTGGGKTEAYLGLAAFTFAVRRRQGVIATDEGQLDGRSGVAVLMRYTLRLLTSQQFQRATTLVCAAELARREDEATWGTEPFRIGLWVGTDVSPKRYDEVHEQLSKVNDGRSRRLTVLQIQRCPWCGTPIEPKNVKGIPEDRRVHVYCGDQMGECPFSDGGLVDDGLPILTVDEEIYRLAPAFVIATVDKFARLAREGEAASLFGYVSKRCDRHGYVHPDYPQCDLKDGSKHPKKGHWPAASVHPVHRLRPPDLIIQDELHLITGALGTTVGLFEVAIDVLTTWHNGAGQRVKPLIIASTATVRNAPDQVRSLYGRGLTVFPPQVLKANETYFSTEVDISAEHPGRRYVGISTTGVRLTTAEIRVSEILMSAAQLLIDRSGDAADPYMTLVGYFNATRELAGMARYMADDIQTALRNPRRGSGFPRRTGTVGTLNIDELTSRVASADITQTLDEMAIPFSASLDSTASKRAWAQLSDARKKAGPKRETSPFDVILATSMLQVGVDVTRLGLMLMVGQPKNTAEYIQASSRVGRVGTKPGLVVTLGNWARPRDLAHYEQFRHHHETFYARVEPLSVTPFSITSLERGLDGVLVSAARVKQATRSDGLSQERSAGRIAAEQVWMKHLIDALSERAKNASDEDGGKLTELRLRNRLDQWLKRREYLKDRGLAMVYERDTDTSKFGPLMMSAENARSMSGATEAVPFVVANSMREVQPEINMLVSPIEGNLFMAEPPGSPKWTMPKGD